MIAIIMPAEVDNRTCLDKDPVYDALIEGQIEYLPVRAWVGLIPHIRVWGNVCLVKLEIDQNAKAPTAACDKRVIRNKLTYDGLNFEIIRRSTAVTSTASIGIYRLKQKPTSAQSRKARIL